MKNLIEWKLQNGKKASVSVELILSENINADGDIVNVKKCEIAINAMAEGHGVVGYGRPQDEPARRLGCVAKIGKLGIKQADLDKINAAIADAEASPEWQAKIARQEKSKKENIEYDAHRAKMRRVMGY